MKNLVSTIFVLSSLILGAAIFAHTGNVLAFGLTSFTSSYLLFNVTGITISGTLPSLFCVLTHIKKGACGIGNPGGVAKVWIISKDQIEGDWGYVAVAGIIAAAPTLIEDSDGFFEVEVTDKKAQANQSLRGASGYSSFEKGLEIKTHGDTAAQTVAIEKLINAEVIAVYQMNDGVKKVLGSTLFPVTLEATHGTGEGGGERGWTISFKSMGDTAPNYFLGNAVTLPIAPAA